MWGTNQRGNIFPLCRMLSTKLPHRQAWGTGLNSEISEEDWTSWTARVHKEILKMTLEMVNHKVLSSWYLVLSGLPGCLWKLLRLILKAVGNQELCSTFGGPPLDEMRIYTLIYSVTNINVPKITLRCQFFTCSWQQKYSLLKLGNLMW